MATPLTVNVDVNVEGLPDLQKVTGELDKVNSSTSKSGDIQKGVWQGVGQQATRMGADLISSGVNFVIDNVGNSISLASDKAESADKANRLFGSSYGIVESASKNAARSTGLSSGAYLEQAGILGNLTTNLGFSGDEAAGMSVDMLQLAADVGSFNNAPTADVVQAMGAAFRGESEPIRAFGVFLDDASVKQKAMEMGLYDGVGAIGANAKAQATYQIILGDTAAAQGNFADTASGYANTQKIAAAEQEEAWAGFGASLLPIATTFTQLVTPAISGVTAVLGILADNLPTVIAILIPFGIAIAVAVVPPFLAWAAATLAATWPLLAIAAAVGAVIFILDQLGILDQIIGWFQTLADILMAALRPAIDAVIGLFQKIWDAILNVGQSLQGPLQAGLNLVTGAFDLLKTPINLVIDVLQTVWDAFMKVVNLLRGPVDAAIGFIRGIFDGLVSGIKLGAGFIGTALAGVQTVFQTLQKIAQDVMGAISSAWNSLWSGIQTIGNQLKTFLSGIFQPLADAINTVMGVVKDAWNAFARMWNGFQINIPKIDIPNPFGGFYTLGGGSIGLPHLPMFAKGGVAMHPMLAGIGEAGPEAVIPLDRLPLGQTVNVYVTAGVGDPVAIGREIVEAIRSFERANGPAF